MIEMTITGIDEIVQLLNRNVQEMPTLNKEMLNGIADEMVREMKNNAHVITGRMKASIYKGVPTDTEIQVGARAPYSIYENERAGNKVGFGPHNFATQAFQTVQGRAWNIVAISYNKLCHGT